MASRALKDIYIKDLRGGINDWDAPALIEDNQVVSARNVDYRAGHIGTRRRGLLGTAQLSNSIFERHVPEFGPSGKNHWNAASGNVTVPTSGYSSGTNVILICLVSTLGTLSGVPTFNGLGMTPINTATQGAFTIAAYRWSGVDLTGGTVTVTTTAGARTCAWAGYFNEVDTAVSPVSAGTATFGAAANAFDYSSNNFTEQFLVVTGISHAGDTSTFTQAVGRVTADSELDVGNVTLGWEFKIGMKPTTWFHNTNTGAATVAAASFFGLKGRMVTSESLRDNMLRVVMRHTPTDNVDDDELWVVDSRGRIDRKAGVWSNGVNRQNWQVGITIPQGDNTYFSSNMTSLHQKGFFALDGVLYADRTTVWDGTVLRWAGFSVGQAPTSADTAPAGTFAGTRYYRVRYIQKDAITGAILRRSEPSIVNTFTPSGVNTGAVVTRPALRTFGAATNDLLDEGETHWELEASADNVTFYLLSTIAIGTATFTDTTALGTPASTTYSSFPLSPSLTEYIPLQAARHVVADDDRIMIGGSPAGILAGGITTWTMSNDSRVAWTPVRADTGVGNDERVPATARFFQDLDGVNSGRLTHLAPAAMGGIWALKEARIHKLTRSGGVPAYNKVQYSDTRGCYMRGACNGTDAQGNPVVYFTDPIVGPCRLDLSGVKDLMPFRSKIVQRIQRKSPVPARTLFYPKQSMVWFSVTLDNQTALPNYMFVWNMKHDAWTDYTGQGGSMLSSVVLPKSGDVYFISSQRTFNMLFIADFGTLDDSTYYGAGIITKAYAQGASFREFVVDGASLHALAQSTDNPNAVVAVALIRDLGIESKILSGISCAPVGTETYVTKELDNATLGECHQIQFSFQDDDTNTQQWTLETLYVRVQGASEVG